MGVPDAILLKPGHLTDQEMEQMKKHAVYGKEALEHPAKLYRQAGGVSSYLDIAKDIAYNHHEKWDGSGYPRGISGDEIPISGR